MEKFKLRSQKLVKKAHIVELYEDELVTPENKIVHYDHIRHHGAAAIIPVDEEGMIFMVRQYRPTIDKFTLEIPAGGLEPGEEMIVCATRECEEETGYQAGEVRELTTIYSAPAYCDEKISIFYTTVTKKTKQNLDENEYVNVERYSLDELTELILNGTIQDSKTVAGILAYRAMIG